MTKTKLFRRFMMPAHSPDRLGCAANEALRQLKEDIEATQGPLDGWTFAIAWIGLEGFQDETIGPDVFDVVQGMIVGTPPKE